MITLEQHKANKPTIVTENEYIKACEDRCPNCIGSGYVYTKPKSLILDYKVRPKATCAYCDGLSNDISFRTHHRRYYHNNLLSDYMRDLAAWKYKKKLLKRFWKHFSPNEAACLSSK